METSLAKIRTVRLVPAQRRELERLCNDRLNWSDGGHWIGYGKEPNCFAKESFANTRTHTVTFPTDQAAFKWNSDWEEAIRYAGHFATAVITVTVTLSTGGTAGIVVGTLAAIFKDELQARVSYPKVARGWKYVLKVTRTSKWSPHPYGKNGLTIESVGRAYDHIGKLQYESKSIARFNFDELPKEIADRIARMPTISTTRAYN